MRADSERKLVTSSLNRIKFGLRITTWWLLLPASIEDEALHIGAAVQDAVSGHSPRMASSRALEEFSRYNGRDGRRPSRSGRWSRFPSVSLKFGSFIATVSDVEPERSVANH